MNIHHHFRPPEYTGLDTLDYAGAHRLATTIQRYWLDKGMAVDVVVLEEPSVRGSTFTVRSNLIRGLPR